MQFAIAMLVVATFLLITGVVGHDTEMGHGGIVLKVRGKVGPVPRFILFIASGIALVLAVLTFITTLPVTDGTAQGIGNPSPIPANPSASLGNASQRTEVTVSLLVGIRPQLGQVDENMTLAFDDHIITTWSADQTNPSKTLTLHATAGTYVYRIQGNYSFYDPSGTMQRHVATGSGEITLTEGLRLGINYLGNDTFQLITFP
jgi:hypothetical protein